MARYLQDRIAHSEIEVLLGDEVQELAGAGCLEQVIVENVSTRARLNITAGAMVVLIGAAPRTEWLAGAVVLDEEGFVLTRPALDPHLREREPWSRLGRAPFLLETSRQGFVGRVKDERQGQRHTQRTPEHPIARSRGLRLHARRGVARGVGHHRHRLQPIFSRPPHASQASPARNLKFTGH
jgi:hypothetical protein